MSSVCSLAAMCRSRTGIHNQGQGSGNGVPSPTHTHTHKIHTHTHHTHKEYPKGTNSPSDRLTPRFAQLFELRPAVSSLFEEHLNSGLIQFYRLLRTVARRPVNGTAHGLARRSLQRLAVVTWSESLALPGHGAVTYETTEGLSQQIYRKCLKDVCLLNFNPHPSGFRATQPWRHLAEGKRLLSEAARKGGKKGKAGAERLGSGTPDTNPFSPVRGEQHAE
ncbi:hypothetical protein C0Q70_15080 [Pomacea canaliculata]|uniref:Uncharacterized protein n=1 Tax=Pomacea canaliculata TaxID=400727 RepID=A0A2T7NTX4_POMCA|nr:hypothetical protein C0Q70_15080 [Pomacea canaliculata]